jgi:hypothetical protein
MVDFLDETIRQSCNEVGGYWLTVDLIKYFNGRQHRISDVWVCRLPQDVVDKAADEVKRERNSDSRAKPCDYFHGIHRYFNKNKYPELGFRRLGLPEETTVFEACDIPYKDDFNEDDNPYPLTYSVAYYALQKFAHLPKEKIFENYRPDIPDLIYDEEGHDRPGVHYHINYEGSQKKLYEKITETFLKELEAGAFPHDGLWEIYTPPERFIFKVEKVVEGYKIGDPIFTIRLTPSKEYNAVPRIKIHKNTDIFDKIIYKSVEQTRKTGQLVGKKPKFLHYKMPDAKKDETKPDGGQRNLYHKNPYSNPRTTDSSGRPNTPRHSFPGW